MEKEKLSELAEATDSYLSEEASESDEAMIEESDY
jgi:hypothetical protein